MSFLNSFKQGFEKESANSLNRQEFSRYRTVTQIKEDKQKHYDDMKDGALLDRINGILFTSEEDKAIIGEILERRGYKKSPDGKYPRKEFNG